MLNEGRIAQSNGKPSNLFAMINLQVLKLDASAELPARFESPEVNLEAVVE